jgi:hypothetical protein
VSWLRGAFDTRTIVLMPIAIALNIVLGQTVGAVLRIPVYLDSIGTILVGVVAGPIPGLVTGLLANLVWTFVVPPPFHSDYAWPFALVAGEIGLVAGLAGRYGVFRSRPNTSWPVLVGGFLVTASIVLTVAWYGLIPFYAGKPLAFFGDTASADPFFVAVGALVGLGIFAALAGLLVLLVVRRDLAVAYVLLTGLGCGILSAIISAPISATLFGGVTGSGADLLVAAFQQAGSDLGTAVLQQGLLQDPIDKTMEFFIVYAILQVVSRRITARFPQGERALGVVPADGEEELR